MTYTEDQLRQAVDAVFAKYDADKSGTLESGEVFNLINDALNHMGSQHKVTPD